MSSVPKWLPLWIDAPWNTHAFAIKAATKYATLTKKEKTSQVVSRNWHGGMFSPPNWCRATQHPTRRIERGRVFHGDQVAGRQPACTHSIAQIFLGLHLILRLVWNSNFEWFLLRVWRHVGLFFYECCGMQTCFSKAVQWICWTAPVHVACRSW